MRRIVITGSNPVSTTIDKNKKQNSMTPQELNKLRVDIIQELEDHKVFDKSRTGREINELVDGILRRRGLYDDVDDQVWNGKNGLV